MSLLEWMPDAKAERIITHWTAGTYDINQDDRQHYHFIIARDGSIVRGVHPINANDNTADGIYAAHTRGANTRAIGVAVACMAGAQERPFKAGPYPMLEIQWVAMARLCAQLCQRYGITPGPDTVLGHGEIGRILKIPQRGKWDPLAMPWEEDAPSYHVGDRFRAKVWGFMK